MATELNDAVLSLLEKNDFVECDSDYNICQSGIQGKNPATINCVNFEMDDSTIRFKRLMSGLVYSPSARFAVNITTSAQRVTSLYVLDPFNMQFNRYRNSSGKDIDMEVMYWYNEDCLVFIHIDKKTTNLHQTTVVLNHIAKTYEFREFVSYIVPSRISFETTSQEAQSIEIEGKKYVLLVSVTDDLQDVYAISHSPDQTVKLKKYLFDNTAPLQTVNFMNRTMRDDITHMFLSTQISVINNKAYFSVRFHCKESDGIVRRKDISEVLGIYIEANFEKMPVVPATSRWLDPLRIDNYVQSLYDGHHVSLNRAGMQILFMRKDDIIIRSAGTSKKLNNNLVFLSEEKKSEANVSTISFIDVRTGTVKTPYNIVHAKNSDVVVCLTPFNILITKKISSTQISCSTIPYPFKSKTPPTLQEMTLSYTYLNSNVNQNYSTKYRVKRSC